jgi:hypothetical protein
MGVDVMLLPKLAAEGDPSELRRKVFINCCYCYIINIYYYYYETDFDAFGVL